MSQEKETKEKPDLKALVSGFPKTPGVYLMKDRLDKIIYVGKAKDLRSRVKSYFANSKDHSPKTKLLVQNIRAVSYILTDTEVEAFLLEASLIKKHRPRYNIRLKDDKSYPYIKLSAKDDFPRFYIARKVKQDGALYFGPYTSGLSVRETIKFLNRSFQIRDCKDSFMKGRTRPCLTYQIGRCSGPCVDLVTKESYSKDVENALNFLRGKKKRVVSGLEKQMQQFADKEKFEAAARVRDSLEAIERILEKQAVINAKAQKDQDAIGFFGDDRGTLIETLHIRKGRVLGNKSHFFPLIDTNNSNEDTREWLMSFVTQFYQENLIPDELILPIGLGNDVKKLLGDVFKVRYKKEVKISYPTGENSRSLVQMANKNAESHFQEYVSKSQKKRQGLEVIQKKFHLKEPPYRIECFDISTFQGTETVASQVVFEDGVPNKAEYRLYKIKTVDGIDDFASMKEVLTRRFNHGEWADPDLIVVDGGKGQLKMATEALSDVGFEYIPVVGLAKQRTKGKFDDVEIEKTKERFYLPGRSNPVTFAEGSAAFQILVGIRDEAHRFAITFHRKRREQGSLASVLDEVDGLSEELKKRLLKEFSTVEGITEASEEDLIKKGGVSKKIASKLLSQI